MAQIEILPRPKHVHQVVEYLNFLVVSDPLRANMESIKRRVKIDGKLVTQAQIEKMKRKELAAIVQQLNDYDEKNDVQAEELSIESKTLTNGESVYVDTEELTVGESTAVYDLARQSKWVDAYIELMRTRVTIDNKKVTKSFLMNMSIADFMLLVAQTTNLMLQAVGVNNDDEELGK